MDAITAVSGSGPAYYALLAEAMIEAACCSASRARSRRSSSCRRCSARRGCCATRTCTRSSCARWSPRRAARRSARSASSSRPASAPRSSTRSTPRWSARKSSPAAMMIEPTLHVLDDPARAVAALLAEAARRGETIGLTGGHAVGDAYEQAAALEPDWSRATVWWGDERCVPPEDERSNFLLARRTLLDHLERGAGGAPHPRRARPRARGDRVRRGARRRTPRHEAARPRPRRARRIALPRLAAAGRARAPCDERAGRARAVRRPRDDDAADDPHVPRASSSSSPAPTRPTPCSGRCATRSTAHAPGSLLRSGDAPIDVYLDRAAAR